jgi:hypothetical protein
MLHQAGAGPDLPANGPPPFEAICATIKEQLRAQRAALFGDTMA